MKKAFTMMELVFVIAIIGVLAAIAVPKFAATRDDAFISRARATVSSLRNAIATERQKRVLRGEFDDITGDEAVELLEYGLTSDWSQDGDTFTFTAPDGSTCEFVVEDNKLKKDSCDVGGMNDL